MVPSQFNSRLGFITPALTAGWDNPGICVDSTWASGTSASCSFTVQPLWAALRKPHQGIFTCAWWNSGGFKAQAPWGPQIWVYLWSIEIFIVSIYFFGVPNNLTHSLIAIVTGDSAEDGDIGTTGHHPEITWDQQFASELIQKINSNGWPNTTTLWVFIWYLGI